jgi:hypothetical protein
VSSGLLRRVALVRPDVSEEPSASFIRMTRIGELETTLAATSNRRTETSVLTRATWRNIPEDDILHSHRRENLKSYRTGGAETRNGMALTSAPNQYRQQTGRPW